MKKLLASHVLQKGALVWEVIDGEKTRILQIGYLAIQSLHRDVLFGGNWWFDLKREIWLKDPDYYHSNFWRIRIVEHVKNPVRADSGIHFQYLTSEEIIQTYNRFEDFQYFRVPPIDQAAKQLYFYVQPMISKRVSTHAEELGVLWRIFHDVETGYWWLRPKHTREHEREFVKILMQSVYGWHWFWNWDLVSIAVELRSCIDSRENRAKLLEVGNQIIIMADVFGLLPYPSIEHGTLGVVKTAEKGSREIMVELYPFDDKQFLLSLPREAVTPLR